MDSDSWPQTGNVGYAPTSDGSTRSPRRRGISLLVAARRGDAGCEAVAIPNALVGRRHPIGCVVYAPIDALER